MALSHRSPPRSFGAAVVVVVVVALLLILAATGNLCLLQPICVVDIAAAAVAAAAAAVVLVEAAAVVAADVDSVATFPSLAHLPAAREVLQAAIRSDFRWDLQKRQWWGCFGLHSLPRDVYDGA